MTTTPRRHNTDDPPLILTTENHRITSEDMSRAFFLSVETGRPVSIRTRPRWWQFWRR